MHLCALNEETYFIKIFKFIFPSEHSFKKKCLIFMLLLFCKNLVKTQVHDRRNKPFRQDFVPFRTTERKVINNIKGKSTTKDRFLIECMCHLFNISIIYQYIMNLFKPDYIFSPVNLTKISKFYLSQETTSFVVCVRSCWIFDDLWNLSLRHFWFIRHFRWRKLAQNSENQLELYFFNKFVSRVFLLLQTVTACLRGSVWRV